MTLFSSLLVYDVYMYIFRERHLNIISLSCIHVFLLFLVSSLSLVRVCVRVLKLKAILVSLSTQLLIRSRALLPCVSLGPLCIVVDVGHVILLLNTNFESTKKTGKNDDWVTISDEFLSKEINPLIFLFGCC